MTQANSCIVGSWYARLKAFYAAPATCLWHHHLDKKVYRHLTTDGGNHTFVSDLDGQRIVLTDDEFAARLVPGDPL